MDSTTITISNALRVQLLKLAAELQMKTGRRVDYEDVIRYLISKSRRDANLLKEACRPVGLVYEEFRKELVKGRAEDQEKEEDLERRYC